jgi:hypothetical protein
MQKRLIALNVLAAKLLAMNLSDGMPGHRRSLARPQDLFIHRTLFLSSRLPLLRKSAGPTTGAVVAERIVATKVTDSRTRSVRTGRRLMILRTSLFHLS